jgi:predicted transcriptional regulator
MRAVVKDVMSTHPISVTKDSSFKEMAARLRELKVSGFPVLDDNGKVIGVVSQADMLVMGGGYHGLRGMIAAAVHRTERPRRP